LPHKPVTLLNDLEDIAGRSEPGENKFFVRMNGGCKERPIHHSTNVITWALLEAIETANEEYKNN